MFQFIVYPAGKRFGWKGEIYGSDPRTGLLEVDDEDFAAALRELSKSMRIEEITEGAAMAKKAPVVTPSSSQKVSPQPPVPTVDGMYRFQFDLSRRELRRVTWRGRAHFPNPETGIFETADAGLAKALRSRMERGEQGISLVGPPVPAEVPAGTSTVLEFDPENPPPGAEHPVQE